MVFRNRVLKIFRKKESPFIQNNNKSIYEKTIRIAPYAHKSYKSSTWVVPVHELRADLQNWLGRTDNPLQTTVSCRIFRNLLEQK